MKVKEENDKVGLKLNNGAKWTGTDISPEQIEQAKKLAKAENMITCRGVGASLSDEQLKMWDKEHRELLERIAPEEFEVLHYAALLELKKR